MLWVKGVWRSRRLVKQYREASPEQRAEFEKMMDRDIDLDAHMRPLPWWEVAVVALFISVVVGLQVYRMQ